MIQAEISRWEPLKQEPPQAEAPVNYIYDDNGNLSTNLVSRSRKMPLFKAEGIPSPDYHRAMRRVRVAVHRVNSGYEEGGEQELYYLDDVVKALEVKEDNLMILIFNVNGFYSGIRKTVEALVWAYSEVCMPETVWRFIETPPPPSPDQTPPSSPKSPSSSFEALSIQQGQMEVTPPPSPKQPNFSGLIDAQIKEWNSMGYDVDSITDGSNTPPGAPFYVISNSEIMNDLALRRSVMFRVDMALDGINAEAQVMGQKYEFEEMVKFVERFYHFAIFKFKAKEVTSGAVRTVEAMVAFIGFRDHLTEWRFV